MQKTIMEKTSKKGTKSFHPYLYTIGGNRPLKVSLMSLRSIRPRVPLRQTRSINVMHDRTCVYPYKTIKTLLKTNKKCLRQDGKLARHSIVKTCGNKGEFEKSKIKILGSLLSCHKELLKIYQVTTR